MGSTWFGKKSPNAMLFVLTVTDLGLSEEFPVQLKTKEHEEDRNIAGVA